MTEAEKKKLMLEAYRHRTMATDIVDRLVDEAELLDHEDFERFDFENITYFVNGDGTFTESPGEREEDDT